VRALVCTRCAARYPADEPRWKCDCGGLLDLEFSARFDRAAIRGRAPGLWRYREALPLAEGVEQVSLGESLTPLTAFWIGGRAVLVKQDQLFSTGSYKDRGAAVLVSQAKAAGVRQVVEDSSGNAGCAVAAYCARAGIACQIFVPASTSPAKTAQIRLYGAELVLTPGSREDTARAVLDAARQHYYASHSWNPYFFHGTKTWAFEVWEQLGWRAPDVVVLPAGNGTLVLGAWIGFNDLLAAREIERLPRIIAVQSENCAPLAQAFARGGAVRLPEGQRETLAEGIAIAAPVRGEQVVQAVRDSGGSFVTVSDAQVEAALREIGRQGACIEPTAAAAVTAAGELEDAGETVVTVFTGHGLKSAEKMEKILGRG
jgi:threonine synthase